MSCQVWNLSIDNSRKCLPLLLLLLLLGLRYLARFCSSPAWLSLLPTSPSHSISRVSKTAVPTHRTPQFCLAHSPPQRTPPPPPPPPPPRTPSLHLSVRGRTVRYCTVHPPILCRSVLLKPILHHCMLQCAGTYGLIKSMFDSACCGRMARGEPGLVNGVSQLDRGATQPSGPRGRLLIPSQSRPLPISSSAHRVLRVTVP